MRLLRAIYAKLYPPPTPPDPPMATVTKSIGTTGRDYSTITLWEADLDSDPLYDAGDNAVGECYNDSAFNEALTINGGGTIGLASRTLSVAAGQRHNGTAGSGARIVRNARGNVLTLSISGTTVEWLEINMGGKQSGAGGISGCLKATANATIRNAIVHNITESEWGYTAAAIGVAWTISVNVTSCVLYNLVTSEASNTYLCIGVWGEGGGGTIGVYNCSIYRVGATGSRPGYGVTLGNAAANLVCKNVIATSCLTADFNSVDTQSNNLSSDETASGDGSLTSKTAANQFVSTVSGSEDLHLKAGADAIDAGTDLATTPTGVNIDIDGRDRDAEGDTWDIGADEYVAVAAAGSPISKRLGGVPYATVRPGVW